MPPVVPVCQVIGNCLGEKRVERVCIMSYLGLFDGLVCYVVLLNVQVLSKCPPGFSVVEVG